jgi:hypothetical protein
VVAERMGSSEGSSLLFLLRGVVDESGLKAVARTASAGRAFRARMVVRAIGLNMILGDEYYDVQLGGMLKKNLLKGSRGKLKKKKKRKQ